MRIPKKIALFAVPAVLVVGVMSAMGVAARAPVAGAAAVASASAVRSTKSSVETKDVVRPATPVSKALAAVVATEPAGGHSDEAAGATTESNVDHQFNGVE